MALILTENMERAAYTVQDGSALALGPVHKALANLRGFRLPSPLI